MREEKKRYSLSYFSLDSWINGLCRHYLCRYLGKSTDCRRLVGLCLGLLLCCCCYGCGGGGVRMLTPVVGWPLPLPSVLRLLLLLPQLPK